MAKVCFLFVFFFFGGGGGFRARVWWFRVSRMRWSGLVSLERM